MDNWVTKFLRNYGAAQEPSDYYVMREKQQENVRQRRAENVDKTREVVSGAVDTAMNAPREYLKESISGDKSEWFSPEGLPVPLYAAGNTFLDIVADPINLIGGGLFTGGVNSARALSGANSLKGNALSSARNYIPNNYAPSGNAQAGAMDNLVFNQKEKLAKIPKVGPMLSNANSPQEIANIREKVTSFGGWAADSAARGIQQTLSPSQRATYRGQGINKTTQDVAKEALAAGTPMAEAKAVAQSQASSSLIPDQAGRVGPKAQAVKDIENRSYLTEPVPATEGSYSSLIKDNDLKGRYESGRAVSVSDNDLNIIDNHVRNIWKGADGKPLGETKGAHIRIKNAGSGDMVSGQHHFDFQSKSGVVSSLKPLFKEGNLTERQLWDRLNAMSKANVKTNKNLKKGQTPKWTLSGNSDTFEKAQKNGMWVTGSFVGNAVTEGGVNYLAKVTPNGKVMGVISDEHNFLEKVPVVGRVVTESLPNRSLSVTPPMHFDLKGTSKKVKSEQPQNKVPVKESLQAIADAKPSAAALNAERRVNAGAGMLTGNALVGDEERGP